MKLRKTTCINYYKGEGVTLFVFKKQSVIRISEQLMQETFSYNTPVERLKNIRD